ncbi:MAG: hypothetical protein ACRCWQ_08820 [Bacilli bacterium]
MVFNLIFINTLGKHTFAFQLLGVWKKEANIQTAKKLLALGVEISTIIQATNLTQVEVLALKVKRD